MKKKAVFLLLTLVLVLPIPAASSASSLSGKTGKRKGGTVMTLKVTSPAFSEGALIPAKHTCDGQNTSPPLTWSGVPSGSKSLALICDDPDAPMAAPDGAWVHWVLYNIPASATSLNEALPRDRVLQNGAKQGVNDSRNIGYDGPCPPGGTHRYYFKMYALDQAVSLEPGAAKSDLLKAMSGHILAEGQLMGLYRRR